MPPFIASVRDLFHRYDTFIVDLWGVTHNGFRLFPNALEIFQFLHQHGKQIFFLSNASRRCQSTANHLAALGLSPELYTGLYTSGEDAYQTLKAQQRGKICFSLIAQDADLLRETGAVLTDDLSKADYFLNTQWPNLPPAQIQGLLKAAISLNLPMICVNPDITVLSGEDVLYCAGSLAESYHALGGAVTYHGKPHPSIYQNLWEKTGRFDKARTLALGDALDTDIRGAHAFGIDSVLVLSGLEGHALGLEHTPFPQLDKVYSHCLKKGVLPAYIMKEIE